MSEPLEHDWPPTKPYYGRRPEIIDAEYRVIRQRPALGFMSCVMIVTVAAIFLLRFAWPAVIMLFAFSGVPSPAVMLGVVVGLIILGAAWLQAKVSRRPF